MRRDVPRGADRVWVWGGSALVAALSALGTVACEEPSPQEVGTQKLCNDPVASQAGELAIGADLCDRYQSTYVGGYRIQNNVWNDAASTQCTTARGDGNVVGFDVHGVATSTGSSPAAYPSIVRGWHFGDWSPGSAAVKVSDLTPVTASWVTTRNELGVYNTAYDLWVHPDATTAGATGGLEIMI